MGLLPIVVRDRRSSDRDIGRLEGKVDGLTGSFQTFRGDFADAIASIRAEVGMTRDDSDKHHEDHEIRLRSTENAISAIQSAIEALREAVQALREAAEEARRQNRWRIGIGVALLGSGGAVVGAIAAILALGHT